MSGLPVNQAAFDRFTLLHMLTGFVCGYYGQNPILYMTGSVGWEMVEDALKDSHPELFPNPSHDSKANALGDVYGGFFGYCLGLAMHKSRNGG